MVKNSFGTDFLKNLFRSDFERLEMHITVLIRIIANDLQVIDGEGFLLLALQKLKILMTFINQLLFICNQASNAYNANWGD